MQIEKVYEPQKGTPVREIKTESGISLVLCNALEEILFIPKRGKPFIITTQDLLYHLECNVL